MSLLALFAAAPTVDPRPRSASPAGPLRWSVPEAGGEAPVHSPADLDRLDGDELLTPHEVALLFGVNTKTLAAGPARAASPPSGPSAGIAASPPPRWPGPWPT